MTTKQTPRHETPEEWWERVRREHGPAPERVQKVWRDAVRKTIAREEEEAAKP